MATEPVRVLWLVKGLGVGGIERLLCWWSAHRDAGAVSYHVAHVLDDLNTLGPTLVRSGTPVTSLGARRTLDPRWPRRLHALMAESQFDVVHAHAPDLAAAALSARRLLPEPTRPRVAVTDHNVWPDFRWPSRVAHRLTCRFADAHLVVSEAVRRSAPPRVRGRLEVLIPGVPVAEIRAALGDRSSIRQELGVTEDEVVVMTLANYRPPKRYPDLFQAMRIAIDAGAPLRLIAIGSGPMERELQALATSLGLADRIVILGLRDDASELLAGADVFALASGDEGGPLAVLEAMAAGLPVVSTGVGVVPDVVTDGVEGVIVPVAAPQAMADALVALSADADRRAKMGAAAARRVEEFDLARSARRLEAVYASLARRSGRTG